MVALKNYAAANNRTRKHVGTETERLLERIRLVSSWPWRKLFLQGFPHQPGKPVPGHEGDDEPGDHHAAACSPVTSLMTSGAPVIRSIAERSLTRVVLWIALK